ncbi:MAG: TonB-dependent receptor [Bacteroidia bacterium]|jgi:hypothetical protein
MKKLLPGILILFVPVAYVWGQASQVSLTIRNKPLKVALLEVEQQAGISFSYSSDAIDVDQKISLQIIEKPLSDVLELLFKNTGILYSIQGTQVVLMPAAVRMKTISGYIHEAGTGELIIGAQVHTRPRLAACITNSYGFYSLTLPVDSYTLVIEYSGFKTQNVPLLLQHEIQLNIILAPSGDLDEALVTAKKDKTGIQLNKIEVPVNEIKTVPMILGEKDVAKYIMLFPGVQKGNEGNGYMYVRGGGPDQNLILIDDAIIYNAYHFLGLASLFSGSELRSAELYKGGFSSRYGGRLSSVLDMSMKDGNREKLGLDATIGVISSRFMLEGPIQKGKSSFLISARRSYIDQTAGLLSKKSDAVLNYMYYDVHAKIAFEWNIRNRIMTSIYIGSDGLANNTDPGLNLYDDGISWGNMALSLRWNHQFSGKLFSNTSLVSSSYNSRIAFGEVDVAKSTKSSSAVQSSIQDYTFKHDLDFLLNTKHHFKMGAGVTRHLFNPVTSLKYMNPDSLVSDEQPYKADEGFAYLEWNFRPGKKWECISGLRYVYFNTTQTYQKWEPRFQLRYSTFTNWQFNFSYAAMNQFLHLISAFNGFGLPADAWVASDDRLQPQHSDQFTLGLVKNDIGGKGISISCEAFVKDIQHAVAIKEGASFFQVLPTASFGKQYKTWSELATQGNSEAMGLEWMLHKRGKRISGHISYTLSRTLMQFDSINLGRTYHASFDRTHDLGIFISFHPGRHWQFSAIWVYGTGNAITLPAGEYNMVIEDPGQTGGGFGWPEAYYEKKNAYRMQSYHRLDVSLQYSHKFAGINSTIELSVYNVYNRANPFFYQIENEDAINGTGKRILQKVSLFPVIPSVSWSVKF